MERFVVRLATERATASHRNQFLHVIHALRERADHMSIGEFNQLDRRIDQLFVSAAGELFLESTLRPLHTISRRIGSIYHSKVRPDAGLGRTLACHLAILEAVAARQVEKAIAASDRLMAFSDSMFDALAKGLIRPCSTAIWRYPSRLEPRPPSARRPPERRANSARAVGLRHLQDKYDVRPFKPTHDLSAVGSVQMGSHSR